MISFNSDGSITLTDDDDPTRTQELPVGFDTTQLPRVYQEFMPQRTPEPVIDPVVIKIATLLELTPDQIVTLNNLVGT